MVAPLAVAALTAIAAIAGPGGTPPEAGRILEEALRGGATPILADLTDRIGPRLAGSAGADAAVEWAVDWCRRHGLRARREPVQVTRWTRGEESASIVAGEGVQPRAIGVTALGRSGPTPEGGIVAEVIEADSLDALAALGSRVAGRIVLLQHDMRVADDYGRFSALRTRGPAAAARLGAAAVLVRSLTTARHALPHTGTTMFPPGERPIPAAAIPVEDAELLHRLLARGPVRVRLVLGGRTADPPLAPSANVICELRGGELPGEVVVIGAHLDSWDLGTGAVDDGAGVAMVLESLRIAASMPRPPRRTLRAVLFMNEENGAEGAVGYFASSQEAGVRHVAAMEADSGGGRPTGVKVSAGPGGIEAVRAMAAPLAPLGADGVGPGGGGVDVSPLEWAGVPLLSLSQDTSRYFDWHHSAADTFDKVDPRALAEATAALAWMAWALADAPEPLPPLPVPRRDPWWKQPAR
ncbi:MAG TPA: M28 family peptidase [Anaeromyxobacteraceae bacterium]|nr:M28 family peptidase [Anaeromyxobacteraceae bacterium]